jgi:hypothetical protein
MLYTLIKRIYYCLLVAICTSNAIAAQIVDQDVVLIIREQVNSVKNKHELQLTIKQLQALPQLEIKTRTRWTQGEKRFTGPLLRDVLALSVKNARHVAAIAINGYRVDIPLQDYLNIDVILALTESGKALTLRTKGPIWIIYPWSDQPELEQGVYYSRAVWQLSTLELYD